MFIKKLMLKEKNGKIINTFQASKTQFRIT